MRARERVAAPVDGGVAGGGQPGPEGRWRWTQGHGLLNRRAPIPNVQLAGNTWPHRVQAARDLLRRTEERLKYAIVGGTGMIGTALAEQLRARGDDVLIVTRRSPSQPHEVQWDPKKGVQQVGRLEGLDALFNLAGAPLAGRPWTARRRETLLSSRVGATEVLLASLGRLRSPPAAYVGAGGLGLFGDRGEEVLSDDATRGTGFLADLADSWERQHLRAVELDARTSVLRMSIVLSPTGGAFPLMVRPFRVMGGWLGNGRQWTSWISIRDCVCAMIYLADQPECEGAFNGTVPLPLRNKEWCKALGRVLNRPVRTHAPKWVLRGALGDLADELLIASVRAVPDKLLRAGFCFRDPDAEASFQWMVAELARMSRQAE